MLKPVGVSALLLSADADRDIAFLCLICPLGVLCVKELILRLFVVSVRRYTHLTSLKSNRKRLHK